MKRQKLIYFVMLGAVSCSTVPPPEPESPGTAKDEVRLVVGTGPVSKTVMGEEISGICPVYWCDGDRIAVNGKRSEALYGIEPQTSEATFSISGVSAPYNVVYPSWICQSIEGSMAIIELPRTQTCTPTSFGNGCAVMYASSQTSEMELKNLCGAVCLNFDFGKYEITDISLTSLGTPLSGKFSLDTGSGKLEGMDTRQSVRIDMNEAIQASGKVIFTLPAAEYGEGFNILLSEKGGRQMSVALREDCEVAPGIIKYYPQMTFEPEGSLIITDAESWNSFVLAVNGGDWSEWQDPETGCVKLSGNIIAGGDLAQIEVWNGELDGNGYSITRNLCSRPLIKAIGETGKVSNLIFEGGHAEVAEASFAALAQTNFGTVTSCENRMPMDIVTDADFSFASLVESNAGTMENCSNSAPVHISLPCSANRFCQVGGLALYASAEGKCGSFTGCSNSGEILIEKNAVASSDLQKGAVGGIVSSVEDGDADNFTVFRECSNSGRIQLWENTWYNTPNGAYAIGGIAGRISGLTRDIAGNKSWYVSFDKAWHHVEFVDCVNSAVIDVCCSNTSTVGKSMSGARQCYVGGIAGVAVGLAESPALFSGCTNTGQMNTGGSTKACTISGGIAGGAGYATFSDCSCSAGFALTETTGVTAVGPGAVAGIATHIFTKLLPVVISSCTVTSALPETATVKGEYSATGAQPTIGE